MSGHFQLLRDRVVNAEPPLLFIPRLDKRRKGLFVVLLEDSRAINENVSLIVNNFSSLLVRNVYFP